MADTNLSDDMIKLVEYTIVDTGRDSERVIFGPHQVTETRNRSARSFKTAKISRFFADLPRINRERTRRGQPELEPEKADLEVYYRVLERWTRKSRRLRKRRLERLAEIRDAIEELRRVAAANEAARPAPVPVGVPEAPPAIEPPKAKKKAARRKPRKSGTAKAKKRKKRTARRRTAKPNTSPAAPRKKAAKPRLRAPGAAPEAAGE